MLKPSSWIRIMYTGLPLRSSGPVLSPWELETLGCCFLQLDPNQHFTSIHEIEITEGGGGVLKLLWKLNPHKPQDNEFFSELCITWCSNFCFIFCCGNWTLTNHKIINFSLNYVPHGVQTFVSLSVVPGIWCLAVNSATMSSSDPQPGREKSHSHLLRKASNQKMALKEKIVQIYEAFFQVILFICM